MKIYICGQKYFGFLALKMIVESGHEVVGVSAPVDDRLWAAACNLEIPVMPSGKLNAQNIPGGVDLVIAAHSHDFIGRATRNRLRLGAIGFHPSLLPLHRGRDAIKWAFRFGEKITGGSVFWLNDTTDGGPIAAQDWCWIEPGETPEGIWREKLQPMGIMLLKKTIDDISNGVIVRIPQNHKMATWEPSLNPPPLYRPDLLQIGDSLAGYSVVVDKEYMPVGM